MALPSKARGGFTHTSENLVASLSPSLLLWLTKSQTHTSSDPFPEAFRHPVSPAEHFVGLFALLDYMHLKFYSRSASTLLRKCFGMVSLMLRLYFADALPRLAGLCYANRAAWFLHYETLG